jgi:hypothetical protein
MDVESRTHSTGQNREERPTERFEGRDSGSGIQAYRASFRLRSLIVEVRSSLVEVEIDPSGFGNSIASGSRVETDSPFVSAARSGSSLHVDSSVEIDIEGKADIRPEWKACRGYVGPNWGTSCIHTDYSVTQKAE